jgi:hypothetical protein
MNKYLIILIFFLPSCSQVERVGDEPKSSNWISNVDEYVKTKENKDIKVEPKKAIKVKEPALAEYEFIDCANTSDNCVKKVKINTPNKFGVNRVWIEYNQRSDGDIMNTNWKLYSYVYVATKDDDEDVWFGYKDVDIDDIEEEKETLLEEAEKEMKKTIKKILSKPLKNE